MRVAFVMPGVGVVGRGAEAFVVELATALATLPAAGGVGAFEVELFCRGALPGAPFPVHRIGALPRDAALPNALYGANRLLRKGLDTLFLDPLSLEWYTAALAAFPALWRGDFDAVVMEGGIVGAWLCRLLRLARGVPFVDLAHGLDPKWEGAFARQHPDAVVTFTAAAARMLRREAPEAAVAVIPHGVDLELFRPNLPAVELPLERPVVLAAGAVDAHKRMHLAVEAAAAAGASLVLLGDGPEAAAVDLLAERRLGRRRYLRRTVPRSEMSAWYRAADVFTLPSKTESFGLTYLEALACGLPAVAPDDAVRREVIGEAGIYCDVLNRESYAAALASAASRAWGELPRRRAERFPVGETVAAYARLLHGLRGLHGG
jgi:glycosyltransferase involved in cell wall biosynthesis